MIIAIRIPSRSQSRAERGCINYGVFSPAELLPYMVKTLVALTRELECNVNVVCVFIVN